MSLEPSVTVALYTNIANLQLPQCERETSQSPFNNHAKNKSKQYNNLEVLKLINLNHLI